MRNSNASNRRFWRNSTSSRSLIVCRPTRHSLSLSLSLFHHKKKTHIIIKMKETNLQEESHASAQLITNTTMLNTRERSEAGVKKELKKNHHRKQKIQFWATLFQGVNAILDRIVVCHVCYHCHHHHRHESCYYQQLTTTITEAITPLVLLLSCAITTTNARKPAATHWKCSGWKSASLHMERGFFFLRFCVFHHRWLYRFLSLNKIKWILPNNTHNHKRKKKLKILGVIIWGIWQLLWRIIWNKRTVQRNRRK